MVLIRQFEEAVVGLYRDGEIPGFVHVSLGAEASAVGIAGALSASDRLTTTHRGHGHMLAKGVPPKELMAEIFGRADGICGGWGGSMHGFHAPKGVLGSNGIVGAGAPIAAGSALQQRLREKGGITVAFFGEGAITTGNVHEALSLAAHLRLPAVFVCEYNGWVEFSRFEELATIGSITGWASTYGLQVWEVSSGDVRDIRLAAEEAISVARRGAPCFIQVSVSRLRGHYEGDQQRYRRGEDQPIDPLGQIEVELPRDIVEATRDEIRDVISDAVEFARNSPWPEPSGMRS